MGNKIHIIGGGTFSHVRNHLALAAPAFGETARQLYSMFISDVNHYTTQPESQVKLHLTKMANSNSKIVTNQDVSDLIDTLIADPDTRVIILNAALCDYDGDIVNAPNFEVITPSGKYAKRLKTSEGTQIMYLTPAEKLIGKIRKERKDIFVVGFKTTTEATSHEQYLIGLDMLKKNSLNLVLANDTVTRNNMIITPEESRYAEGESREDVLKMLVQMVLARMNNTFTRSTVVDGVPVAWDSPKIPDNLRQVVNHCIEQGAYKPFNGATVGHFAVKVDDNTILTSKRKRNFNNLDTEGLVMVEYEGNDHVVAYGAKPSVGGQSQRIIFSEHPGFDCIVHFHCPMQEIHEPIQVASQWQNECGSHQCGENTSQNLREVANNPNIKVVMLDNHGPNIVFKRDTPANDVIDFINANFDLKQKTGGLVA